MKCIIKILALFACVASQPVFTSFEARAEDDGIVSIGWTAWSDAEAVSKLVAIIVGQGMKTPIELTLSDIDVQYRNVANGNLDLMLMSWQPATHGDYIAKYGNDLVNLGAIYSGTKLGWAVPAYIPKDQVATPVDLKKHADKFGKRIIGIDPAAGLMKRTRALMEGEGFVDWTLEEGTGPLMTKKVIEASEKKEWIVATLWSPHWLFTEVEMRYLDDPSDTFGPAEAVYALARKDFRNDYPEIGSFIERFSLEIGQLEALMADALALGHRQAVHRFIEENRDLVDYWITGQPG